jgi:outer membrane immunogenic protein
MKKILIAACAFTALSVGSANAADIIEEAVYDWSGLYAGLNAGFAFGGDDQVGLYPAIGDIGDLSLSGMFGGLGVGYNHQVDQIVLGIEADIQLSGISDDDENGDFEMSNDVNYFGTLRARAGMAFDRTLLYGTGGLAFASFDYKVQNAVIGLDIDEDYSKLGFVVGGGIEHAIDDDWSVKAEYLYANFGKEGLDDLGQTTKATPDFHSVRVGVNFKF